MADDTSTVSDWLLHVKDGDQRAAQRLWERYVDTLVRLARVKLGSSPRRLADEEDVVARAFENFFRGVKEGRFSRLEDRRDLWQILVMLTDRRAKDFMRQAGNRRRHEVGESAIKARNESSEALGFAQVSDVLPTPQLAAQFIEDCSRRLDQLKENMLRQVAELTLEGFTNQEVAQRLGCTERTVERKLNRIRAIWQEA